MATATLTANPVTTKIIDWALDEAGFYDIYKLRNVETGEIDFESMQQGCYTNFGEDWTVLVCVRAHEVARAARAGKSARAAMRRLLEAYT